MGLSDSMITILEYVVYEIVIGVVFYNLQDRMIGGISAPAWILGWGAFAIGGPALRLLYPSKGGA